MSEKERKERNKMDNTEKLKALLQKHNIHIKNTENEREFLIEFFTKNVSTCKKYIFKKIKNIPISKRFENKVRLYMQISYAMEDQDLIRLIKSHFKEEHYKMLTELCIKTQNE